MPISKQQKQEIVAGLKKDLSKYAVVGVASFQNLPQRQFNIIKKKLGTDVKMTVTRSTLIKRAIEEGNPKLKELENHMQGTTALVFTALSPFKLAKILRQSKSKVAAKPGMIAENDIVIPAGETNLPPGPALSELKAAKIDARIQGTKIVIAKDAVIVKKGEAVTTQASGILLKLGYEPFEVGLRVTALWENGTIYPESILNVDDSYYLQTLQSAAMQALNLAVFAEIYNPQSAPLILAKAVREANALKKEVDSKTPAQQASTDASASTVV